MVGTPGRICALLQKGNLVTPSLGLLVLDEADKLMSDTFFDDVLWLHSVLPSKKQVCSLTSPQPNAYHSGVS